MIKYLLLEEGAFSFQRETPLRFSKTQIYNTLPEAQKEFDRLKHYSLHFDLIEDYGHHLRVLENTSTHFNVACKLNDYTNNHYCLWIYEMEDL